MAFTNFTDEDLRELVEMIPAQMRDMFTSLRELDLSVENNVETAKRIADAFFKEAGQLVTGGEKAAHARVMKYYHKAKEDADEKINIASAAIDLMNNAIKVLDRYLEMAKLDLNKDIPGSAERIEQRLLESEGLLTSSSQKENRYTMNSSKSHDKHNHAKKNKSKHMTRKERKRRESNASSTIVERRTVVPASTSSIQESRPASANSGPLVAQQQTTSSLSVSVPATSSAGPINSVVPVNCNLGHIRPGGDVIAAAASQAIAATQQMQQGRRTASLKASYEAINSGGGVHAAEFNRECAGAAQTAIAAIQESSKKNKKKVSSASMASTTVIPASIQQQQVQEQTTHQQQQQVHQQQTSASVTSAAAASTPNQQIGASVNSANAAAAPTVVQTNAVADADNHEWTYDPNEPRYCVCNQVSYGEMVACDNLECPVEWFHYPCVNITAPPKGKWYCPQCTAAMKRRGARKN